MGDSLTASKPEGGKNFELVPAGTHVATVFKIINLGHVPYEYMGEKKEGHMIRLFWELPNKKKTFTVDGVEKELPFAISRKLTLSMGPKSNMRPLVVGMTGVQFVNDEEAYGFNIYSLLGHSSLISIVHKKSIDGTKTFANVASASPLIDGMEKPFPVNEQVIYDVTKMSKEEIEALPDYIKEDMKASSEYNVRFLAPRSANPTGSAVAYPEDEINPEDVPF
jgi:hypothetical protein